MKKIITLLAAASFLFTGCSSYVGFEAQQPAYINIPTNLKKVILINRTKPGKKDGYNKIEQMLTGDWAKEDGMAQFAALEELGKTLTNSLRKYEVLVVKDNIMTGSGTLEFPKPLPKNSIDSICKKYGGDFVVALESYDLDLVSKANGLPVMLSAFTLMSQLQGPAYTILSRVKTGWRVYDPSGNTMYDQYLNVTDFDPQRMGITDQEIFLHLPHAKEGFNFNSTFNGRDYGFRISPQAVHRTRTIWTSGNSEMKVAYRNVQTNHWDMAFEKWQRNLNSGRRKVAWRSAYNMAVAYERNGEPEKGLEVLEKAYNQFGKHQLLVYADELRFIIAENKKVQQQVEQK